MRKSVLCAIFLVFALSFTTLSAGDAPAGTVDIVTGATVAAPSMSAPAVQTTVDSTGDLTGFPVLQPTAPIPAQGLTQEQYAALLMQQQQMMQQQMPQQPPMFVQQPMMAPVTVMTPDGVRQFPANQIVPAQPPQIAGPQTRPAQVLQQPAQPGQVIHPQRVPAPQQVIAYPDDTAFGLPAPEGEEVVFGVPVPQPSAFPSGIPINQLQTLTPMVVPFQPMQIQPVQPGMPIQPIPVPPQPEPVPVAPVQPALPMTPEATSAAIGGGMPAPMPPMGYVASLGTPVAGRENLYLISPAEVRQALGQGVQLIILDVRDELVRSIEGNIAGDAHVQFGPAATFPARVSQAIPSAAYPVVVYDSDGVWSSQAAEVMARMGYRVYLMGAYPLWLRG